MRIISANDSKRKKQFKKGANAQQKPRRPTLFSCVHQDYNIWVYNATSTQADMPPYVSIQNISQRGLFSPWWGENSSRIRVNHISAALSRHQPASSHILTQYYSRRIDLLSCPCFVCQEKMSSLELLLWDPQVKKEIGKKYSMYRWDKNE